MTRLAEIQTHIGSMDELLDIIGAMRSLAGMRVQEAQHALPGVRSYAAAMSAALGSAMHLMALPVTESVRYRGRRALVLCTGEHGFVGGFNEKLLSAAQATLGPTDLLFVLGSRGCALAHERGLGIAWTAPMATRPGGAPDAVSRLANELYGRVARGETGRIELMYARYRQADAATVECRPVLPLDTAMLDSARARQVPLHNLAPRPLLEKLVGEFVFALLTEAAVESLASENAARFAAMSSAHDNVSKALAGLKENARQARQSEITAELLDLITGVEAMRTAPARA